MDFLKEKFSEHGTVCNIVIMKDDEGKSRGFGFVKFSLHEEAKKAVECLNGALLGKFPTSSPSALVVVLTVAKLRDFLTVKCL